MHAKLACIAQATPRSIRPSLSFYNKNYLIKRDEARAGQREAKRVKIVAKGSAGGA